MKKILLIDSFGLIFRAYYALIKNPLSTSKGFPTSAIFGFWKMFFRAVKELKPDEVVFCFDGEKSFRKEVYTAYKANREEAPDDLKIQIKYIIEMVQKSGFTWALQKGLEADDLIGLFAVQFADNKDSVYILSSDKDLCQLVNDSVKIAYPEKGIQELKILDRNGVFAKFEVYPEQIAHYLSLTGDSSDNIPGVKGVGPKTAVKLIHDYKDLNGIYANIEAIKSESLKTKLITDKENAYLSYSLIELGKSALDYKLELKNNYQSPAIKQFLLEEFKNLQFKGFGTEEFLQGAALNETKPEVKTSQSNDTLFGGGEEDSLFNEPAKESAASTDKSYKLVLTRAELAALKQRMAAEKLFVFDTETTSEDPVIAELIGVSIAFKPKEAYYIPLFKTSNAEFDTAYFAGEFKDIFENPAIRKIGQNIKYDCQILSRYFAVDGLYFDTMLAAYLLDPDAKKYNMDYLALKYLNYQTIAYSDLVPKGRTLLDVELSKVKDYSCEDADITFRLYETFLPLLKEQNLLDLFQTLEMPFIRVLSGMELTGIETDVSVLNEIKTVFRDKIISLEKEIFKLSGSEFNINSTQQVGEILFEKLGLPVQKKTKTGYSTDESVLEQLSDMHPLPNLLLEYRKINKLLNTYVESLPEYLHGNRIHTSYHQTGTATGRLSSSNPNLQNIPVKEEIGRIIRRAFVAGKNRVLVSLDYSQIELRILAHYADDTNLIAAFKSGKDIHKATAALIFSREESNISEDERRIAKMINFGIIYGMGSFRLSRELSIGFKDAKSFIDRYFEVFKGVREYIESTKTEARKNGFVTTMFGHKRFLKFINSPNRNLREAEERAAVNTVIQGTNADIMKKVMLGIYPELKQFEAFMLLQIHDELLFEVSENQAEPFKTWVKDRMESVVSLKVPLKVDVNTGKNWGEL